MSGAILRLPAHGARALAQVRGHCHVIAARDELGQNIDIVDIEALIDACARLHQAMHDAVNNDPTKEPVLG